MNPAPSKPEENDGRHRKTTLRTFRFSEELAQAIEEEAEKRGITLNALASSILTKHVEWDEKAGEMGFIEVYKPVFMALIGTMDDKVLEQMGRTILVPMWEDMAEFWLQDPSGDRILDFMSKWRNLPYVQTEVKRQGREYTIVSHHDLGPKWSITLRGALDELARKFFRAQPTVNIGETVVTVRFTIPEVNSPI
jgi:hypothetical protein